MGRHGGINILHQKSWHVWTMENQLRVERDELRHKEAERSQAAAEKQARFEGKLAVMRARAIGEEPPPKPEVTQLSLAAQGSRSSTLGSDEAAVVPRSRDTAVGGRDEAWCGQRGVTLSRLQLAEQALDGQVGRPENGVRPRKRRGNELALPEHGLGSGLHINLFEAAEQERRKQEDEHKHLLWRTQKNNEIGDSKSAKTLFSEFDEVEREKPWYLRKPGPGIVSDLVSDLEAERSARLGLPPVPPGLGLAPAPSALALRVKVRLRESHGQLVRHVRPRRIKDSPPALAWSAPPASKPSLEDAVAVKWAAPSELWPRSAAGEARALKDSPLALESSESSASKAVLEDGRRDMDNVEAQVLKDVALALRGEAHFTGLLQGLGFEKKKQREAQCAESDEDRKRRKKAQKEEKKEMKDVTVALKGRATSRELDRERKRQKKDKKRDKREKKLLDELEQLSLLRREREEREQAERQRAVAMMASA